MRVRELCLTFLLAAAVPCTGVCAEKQQSTAGAAAAPDGPAALQNRPDWKLVYGHLPDPKACDAKQLEDEGDLLRVRRFPEEALLYYGYALDKGGNAVEILNRMGMVRLELGQTALAHATFQRVTHMQPKDSIAWSNLGVTEAVTKNFRKAIGDYRRAIRLDGDKAVYHANLGMAYFQTKKMDGARKEFASAVALDPAVMQRTDIGGPQAQLVGTQNYGELCFEMARMFAHEQKEDMMLLWLGRASDHGFDLRGKMRQDATLAPYLQDARVQKMVASEDSLRARNATPAIGEKMPGKSD
jgi:tetratricopeptide (TPR) repeat protein